MKRVSKNKNKIAITFYHLTAKNSLEERTKMEIRIENGNSISRIY